MRTSAKPGDTAVHHGESSPAAGRGARTVVHVALQAAPAHVHGCGQAVVELPTAPPPPPPWKGKPPKRTVQSFDLRVFDREPMPSGWDTISRGISKRALSKRPTRTRIIASSKGNQRSRRRSQRRQAVAGNEARPGSAAHCGRISTVGSTIRQERVRRSILSRLCGTMTSVV